MSQKTWLPVKQALEELGIDRKQLFRMRDDGTCKLGTHYAAFPETRSRDSYRWNVAKVKEMLDAQESTTQSTVSAIVSFEKPLATAA
jgi:hypothetical protein|tara:strand:- start:261 stop:521 length:261 start_codon:yes stop_codon:yes gene_type:complete